MLPSADEWEINRVPKVRRELKFAAGDEQCPAGRQPALAAKNAAKPGHPIFLIRIGNARWLTNLGYCAIVFLAVLALASPARAQQPVVDEFVLDDTIQPVSAGQLDRAIALANAQGAAALLIQMNTPGGLVDSMRKMAGAILSSRVPVIIYVAPAGARAGSAGFFLLESADVAAMAQGTNAGAAHVVFEFGKPDSTMAQKVENDAEAFLRSYVSKRGRNVDAAVAAVQSSKSYTAEEALDKHLIDVIAGSDTQLIAALNGREITRLDGSKQVLHLANARIERIAPTLREELLGWLVDPNIALLLLVGGALLIYLEFNVPGTIVPGAMGTLMVLLAIFGLNLLPIRYTAVLLLLAGAVLLVLEAKFGGHGALAIGGIVCITLGMLTLVAAPIPQLAVKPWVAISISTAFGLITAFLVRLAVRARRRKALVGADALIGHPASAMEPLSPEGHVLVDGEIWRAVANQMIPAGTPLRVVGHEEYRLRVIPVEPPAGGA
jgi:membrane-bound serine protease (ClpP class)